MVNVQRVIFSRLSIKLQKRRIRERPTHWHGHCQKRATEAVGMKKGLVGIFCLLVLTFTSLTVSAQTRYRRYDGRRYEQRLYQNGVYSGRRYRWDRDRSFWDRHRDK